MVLISGSLTDEHVLELSKRIVSWSELMDLGIRVLGLPECVILTTIFDNSDKIQPATHAVLAKWLQQQDNRREAYVSLNAGLRKYGMNQLAAELRQWVEETAARASGTTQTPSILIPCGQSSTSAAPSSDQSLPPRSLRISTPYAVQWKTTSAQKGASPRGQSSSPTQGAEPRQLPAIANQQGKWTSKNTKTIPSGAQSSASIKESKQKRRASATSEPSSTKDSPIGRSQMLEDVSVDPVF